MTLCSMLKHMICLKIIKKLKPCSWRVMKWRRSERSCQELSNLLYQLLHLQPFFSVLIMWCILHHSKEYLVVKNQRRWSRNQALFGNLNNFQDPGRYSRDRASQSLYTFQALGSIKPRPRLSNVVWFSNSATWSTQLRSSLSTFVHRSS